MEELIKWCGWEGCAEEVIAVWHNSYTEKKMFLCKKHLDLLCLVHHYEQITDSEHPDLICCRSLEKQLDKENLQ